MNFFLYISSTFSIEFFPIDFLLDFGSNWDTSDGFAERDTAALAALKSPKRRDYVAESATALAVSTSTFFFWHPRTLKCFGGRGVPRGRLNSRGRLNDLGAGGYLADA